MKKSGCPYTTLKNRVSGYLNFIIKQKRPEYGNMPVCPFVGPELDKDRMMIDVFDPNIETFIERVEVFHKSKYDSALFALVNSPELLSSETRPYQSFLNKLIKKSGYSQYKIICFNPNDDITEIDGYNPRSFAPAFLINIASKQDLNKAHSSMLKTKFFDRMSDAYKKFLKV
tara:strand:+ start:270 stop:785 length:516 start_codon:yes stop_codon:yes gene_type:complete